MYERSRRTTTDAFKNGFIFKASYRVLFFVFVFLITKKSIFDRKGETVYNFKKTEDLHKKLLEYYHKIDSLRFSFLSFILKL